MAQTSDHPIRLRHLETRAETEACVQLQRDIWGPDFADVVPATILMVSQRVGGVAAGAFDPANRLVGFVFGISGVRSGRPAHWSDMLAVRPEARGRGLGRRLKLFQRDRLLELGIEIAYWSYDPLVARNANFNINGLGAQPVEYVINMYGDTGSTLHRGLETDRLVVEWRLTESRERTDSAGALPLDAQHAPQTPATTPAGSDRDEGLPDGPWVRIPVPDDIDDLKARDGERARRRQLATRRAFRWYLARGYEVVGFHAGSADADPWYALRVSATADRRP